MAQKSIKKTLVKFSRGNYESRQTASRKFPWMDDDEQLRSHFHTELQDVRQLRDMDWKILDHGYTTSRSNFIVLFEHRFRIHEVEEAIKEGMEEYDMEGTFTIIEPNYGDENA